MTRFIVKSRVGGKWVPMCVGKEGGGYVCVCAGLCWRRKKAQCPRMKMACIYVHVCVGAITCVYKYMYIYIYIYISDVSHD